MYVFDLSFEKIRNLTRIILYIFKTKKTIKTKIGWKKVPVKVYKFRLVSILTRLFFTLNEEKSSRSTLRI